MKTLTALAFTKVANLTGNDPASPKFKETLENALNGDFNCLVELIYDARMEALASYEPDEEL